MRLKLHVAVTDMVTGDLRHQGDMISDPCDAEEVADILREDATDALNDHLPPEGELPHHPTRIVLTAEVYDPELHPDLAEKG